MAKRKVPAVPAPMVGPQKSNVNPYTQYDARDREGWHVVEVECEAVATFRHAADADAYAAACVAAGRVGVRVR